MASLKDAAERQAFSLAIDATLKSLNKDREKGLLNIVNLAQKFMGSNFRSEAYEGAKKMIQNPDSKWMRYVNRLLDETDPHVAKMTALNLGYQAAFAGTKKIRKMREIENCNIPWLILMDPMMGAQIIGAGVIVHVFTGLPEWVGVVGMGIIVILYCMTGGMKGAMMTDVIQGSLMIATAVVTFIVSIVMGGGFSNINHTLQSMNEAYLTFPGANGYMPWTYYISNIVLWSFFTMGQPHLFTKFFAMKDHKTMFKAILLGTAGMFFSATLIEWAGVNGIASIQNIEKADQIIPMILQRGMNPFLASIFIAGIVAAGMSTIDGILVTTTGAVTRDIYQKIINKNATDEAVMSLSKVVTVIIGIVVICFGVFQPGSIFEINLFAFSGMAIFVVPILFGIYWKKATAKGAIASVIVGIISLLLFTLNPSVKALAMGFHALFPTTIIASIVMIVVSKFTETPPQETIDRHFTV